MWISSDSSIEWTDEQVAKLKEYLDLGGTIIGNPEGKSGSFRSSMIDLAENGMTMVCVTHEMGFARKVANEIVFMDEGSIVERAAPEKFFSDPDSARCKDFLQKILHH